MCVMQMGMYTDFPQGIRSTEQLTLKLQQKYKIQIAGVFLILL